MNKKTYDILPALKGGVSLRRMTYQGSIHPHHGGWGFLEHCYKLKLFMIIFLAIGFVINGVFITLYNVDKSVNIGVVSKEMADLITENNKLTENISVKDSLTEFLKESEASGYNTNVKILYFDQAGTVAQAR